MTYSAGSVILATDYNTFVGSVNNVWNDSGSGNSGYGQTAVATVAATNTVTATQWSTLLSRISSAASHQGTTITGITSPVTGDTISAYAALSTNITSITNARYNCSAVGTSITTGGAGSYAVAWTNSLTFTHTITFASANQARYFFNTGGRIAIVYARSGGTATPAGTALGSLLTACGTLNWTCGGVTQTIAGASYTGTTKVGGSGSPTISTGTGYYQLTAINQQVFQQTTTSYYGYEGDNLTVNIRGSTAAPAPVIYVVSAINRTGTVSGGTVDGTWTATMSLIPSETTYISNTWGTPTMSVATAVT